MKHNRSSVPPSIQNSNNMSDRMPGDILLSAKNISKTFLTGSVETQALRGISLDIHVGEFLVILGESGSGKTTLLNILGALESATSGSLQYGALDLCHTSEKERIAYRREHVGFIFQNYHLMPNLNVIQNLRLIGELTAHPADADWILSQVGLSEKKTCYPYQLSGGQQQRVSIARALMKNPQIIVADEPTAALDYETGLEVLAVFEKIHRDGTTVIMVTHNEQIARLSDRIVRLRSGCIHSVTSNPQPAAVKDLVW